jgi:hypothetical protein
MTGTFFVGSLFRIALARLGQLVAKPRFGCLWQPLWGHFERFKLFSLLPITLGLLFPPELAVGGTAIVLVSETNLPSPSRCQALWTAVPIQVMSGLKTPFATFV